MLLANLFLKLHSKKIFLVLSETQQHFLEFAKQNIQFKYVKIAIHGKLSYFTSLILMCGECNKLLKKIKHKHCVNIYIFKKN